MLMVTPLVASDDSNSGLNIGQTIYGMAVVKALDVAKHILKYGVFKDSTVEEAMHAAFYKLPVELQLYSSTGKPLLNKYNLWYFIELMRWQRQIDLNMDKHERTVAQTRFNKTYETLLKDLNDESHIVAIRYGTEEDGYYVPCTTKTSILWSLGFTIEDSYVFTVAKETDEIIRNSQKKPFEFVALEDLVGHPDLTKKQRAALQQVIDACEAQAEVEAAE